MCEVYNVGSRFFNIGIGKVWTDLLFYYLAARHNGSVSKVLPTLHSLYIIVSIHVLNIIVLNSFFIVLAHIAGRAQI